MNINQIVLNLGEGHGLQTRRLSPPGRARSPGLVRTEEGGPNRSQSAQALGPADRDQLSQGLAARVATVERQQKVELSYGIRVVDQVMEEIDSKLRGARLDLFELVKIFPPYPQNSEERADLLNSYRSLRLQIDKLTFPPESDMATRILGGVKDGFLPLDFRGFQVDSGPAGLALVRPQIPIKDEELPALIDDLDRASGVIKERRTNLRIAAAATFNQEDGDETFYVNMSLEARDQLAAFDATLGRPETGIHNDLLYV